MKKPSLLIGMPCWDKLHWYNAVSLFVLATHWQELGLSNLVLMVIPRRNIVDGRQIVYDKFKNEKEFTHLLSLDDDIGFELDDIKALFRNDKDFVTGMYRWRRDPNFVNAHIDNKPLQYENIKNKGLLEVDSCSLGFALIKRSVIEILGDYTFWRKVGAEQDVNFTKALKKQGIKLWLNTNVLGTHTGEVLVHDGFKIV